MSAKLRATTARKLPPDVPPPPAAPPHPVGSRYGETTSRIVLPRAARLATPRAASASPALEKYRRPPIQHGILQARHKEIRNQIVPAGAVGKPQGRVEGINGLLI
ncbi:MAG: hypothetical protein U1F59_11755 [Candidatus Competibacteraceae bacterium]